MSSVSRCHLIKFYVHFICFKWFPILNLIQTHTLKFTSLYAMANCSHTQQVSKQLGFVIDLNAIFETCNDSLVQICFRPKLNVKHSKLKTKLTSRGSHHFFLSQLTCVALASHFLSFLGLNQTKKKKKKKRIAVRLMIQALTSIELMRAFLWNKTNSPLKYSLFYC